MAKATPGIIKRHARSCGSRTGSGCNCDPTFQAWTWSRRDGKKVRKTFPTVSAAKAWRRDAGAALDKGTMRAPSGLTLSQAAEKWLTGARSGEIRNRSGDRYKPSALRGYADALRLRVLPELGGVRLSEIQRTDVQAFADRLVGQGLDASTIRNTMMPLRVVFRHAMKRGVVAVNPTTDIELPAVRGTRDRIASPDEAAELIGALRSDDQALWAMAMYSGLRLGELRALRWEDIDLQANVIRVERSWDTKEGEIETKSRAGRRTVPVPSVLREYVLAHRLRQGRGGEGLAFGASRERPFSETAARRRATGDWKRENERRKTEHEELGKDGEPALLDAITFHECRHTFASLMIAAGVNAKTLCVYMGHSSVTVTIDRYGHLMPGNEEEAAGLLDAYLGTTGATA